MDDSDDTKRIIPPDGDKSKNIERNYAKIDMKNESKSGIDKISSFVASRVSIYDKDQKQEEENNIKTNNTSVVTINLSPEIKYLPKLYDIDLQADGVKNEKEAKTNERKDNIGYNDCDNIEKDNEQNNKVKKNKPSIFKSVRYYVMLITLISPLVSTYSKNIINFTIIRMIDPEYIKKEIKQPANLTVPYFDLDNSCPVSDDERARLLEELELATNRARNSVGEKFKWDEQQQGWLKAAYSVGHIPLQIAGSRLSEIYSPHIVLTGSVLITAIFSLLAPFMATIHYFLLFIDLFLLGIVGSFITPTLITLFSNWLTPGEKSVMLTCYLITSRIGSALTSKICGSLFGANISWRYIFFSAAGANFFFVIVFFIFATSRPIEHSLISDLELNYLSTKNILVRESLDEAKKIDKNQTELKTITTTNNNNHGLIKLNLKKKTIVEKKKTNPPWCAILTSVPVWSFVITKFCVKLSGDLVSIELPAYLDRVMHYKAELNGDINGYSYIFFCVGCFIAGTLSKIAIKKKPFGLDKTKIRKVFQCFASFGVSLLILGLSFSMCDNIPTDIFLFSWFFVTTFGTGGEQQIPMDITERYSGTIHAIASSLAISGVIVPTIVGAFLTGHPADRDKWKIIWLTASAISAIGGFVFLFGADANIQSFDSMSGAEQTNTIQDLDLEAEKRKKRLNGRENKSFEKDDSVVIIGRNNLNRPNIKSNNDNDGQNHTESKQI